MSTLCKGARAAIARSQAAGAWSGPRFPVEQPIYGAVREGMGEEVGYDAMIMPKLEAARKFAARFNACLRGAMAKGKIQPVKVRVEPGRLERVVEDGFALLGAGNMCHRKGEGTKSRMRPINGEKLVYRVYGVTSRGWLMAVCKSI